MQVAGDLVMQAQDFPMADKLAERLAKTLPPELQEQKPGQAQIPPRAAATDGADAAAARNDEQSA